MADSTLPARDVVPETSIGALDWRDIPVFVVNRNRLGALRQLVDWLCAAGTRRVVIMDNASDYPPLLRYYEELPDGVKVMRLAENHGPYVLWQQGVHQVLDTPYVVTDSDVVPADFCPRDLIPVLLDRLQRWPDAKKIGMGLRIDNLPDSYDEVDTVRKWESQFWEHPIAPGAFAAPVDTTFAIYPARSEFSNDPCNVRLGHPYIAEHTPWYADEAALSAEERYYREHTSKVFSNWSVASKDSWVKKSERVAGFAGRAQVLHLDGGREYIPGWINAGDGEGRFDIAFDVRRPRELPLGLEPDSLDGIHLSHVLEAVTDPQALFDVLHGAARPGARLFVRVGDGARPTAGPGAAQARAWHEGSFAFFAQPALQPGAGSYAGDWQLESVRQIDDPVAPELVATLVAVKPARPRGGPRPVVQVLPQIVTDDRIDPDFQPTAARPREPAPPQRKATAAMTHATTGQHADSLQRFQAMISRHTATANAANATPHVLVLPDAATDDDAILANARASYFATLQTYSAMGISPSDYLGPIWSNNLELHLIPNIRKCRTVGEAIGYLNDKAFYDFSCGEPYLTPSIEWRTDFLQRTAGCAVDALPAEMCESPYVLARHCKEVGGRLLSSDFLNRLAWLFRLESQLEFPKEPFSVLEIGGGFGALARVFRLAYPQARLVLVDIPESLFFQHTFLNASFPEAKHQYIASVDDVVSSDADFVYVPNCFAQVLRGKDFFLAANTNSFGEMPEQASGRWLDLIQSETRTANVFFLNRFLNRIDQALMDTRAGHSSWSFMLDDRWNIRDWEVDPDYERCPYFQTTLTRNLHIIASRDAVPGVEAAALRRRCERLELEDWSRRPGWSDFALVSGADYPPKMSRGDLDLTPDLRKSGTLYALWSLARLVPGQLSFEMLIAYLDYLNGRQTELFFEEIPTLMNMRARLG